MSDLNRKAAELLGWTIEFEKSSGALDLIRVVGDKIERLYDFDPEHNRNHTQLLLDKVAEEKREHEFVQNLRDVIMHGKRLADFSGKPAIWPYITATPAQRTEAFVRTMKQKNG